MNISDFCQAVTETTGLKCVPHAERADTYLLSEGKNIVPFVYNGGDFDATFTRVITPAVKALKSASAA